MDDQDRSGALAAEPALYTQAGVDGLPCGKCSQSAVNGQRALAVVFWRTHWSPARHQVPARRRRAGSLRASRTEWAGPAFHFDRRVAAADPSVAIRHMGAAQFTTSAPN